MRTHRAAVRGDPPDLLGPPLQGSPDPRAVTGAGEQQEQGQSCRQWANVSAPSMRVCAFCRGDLPVSCFIPLALLAAQSRLSVLRNASQRLPPHPSPICHPLAQAHLDSRPLLRSACCSHSHTHTYWWLPGPINRSCVHRAPVVRHNTQGWAEGSLLPQSSQVLQKKLHAGARTRFLMLVPLQGQSCPCRFHGQRVPGPP